MSRLLFQHLSFLTVLRPLEPPPSFVPPSNSAETSEINPNPILFAGHFTHYSFADMGSGASRQELLELGWWEPEALRELVTTTDLGDVGNICSLIPFADEKLLIARLAARPDLDTLFVLYCRSHHLVEQRADLSTLTDGFKANEIWRVLRFPSSSKAAWDWNLQPPLTRDAQEIAHLLHTAVSRAVFRVPLCSWVRYALGYKAVVVDSFLASLCDFRDGIQRAVQESPTTKHTYVNVAKVSKLFRQSRRLTEAGAAVTTLPTGSLGRW